MAAINKLTGTELENHGQAIFETIGLSSFHNLNDVRLLDLDPTGAHGSGEHLELDYLILFGDTCLVGEITSRTSPKEAKAKYKRFNSQFNLVRDRPIEDSLWTTLGVPKEQVHRFREVTKFRGFFMVTKLEKFDVELEDVPNVNKFFSTDCELIEEYSESLGTYSKPVFLSLFENLKNPGLRPLELNIARNTLMQIVNRKIASGNVGIADIFSFHASPYDLLPLADVYRRDLLPSLSSTHDTNYQRPLIPDKLNKIRQHLLSDPTFTFPNSILVVLSNECDYNRVSKTLKIPENHGSISVIDGQHRLFSYANDEVKKLMGEGKIMVTAIKFIDATEDEVKKFSARTFVEINTNQTKIQPTHLYAVAYELLGDISPQSLAAQIVLKVNEQEGKLYGVFDTNQTKLGKIQTSTVITTLKPLCNLSNIKKLESLTKGKKFLEKRGFENLFNENIENLSDAGVFLDKAQICFRRYFNMVEASFRFDFPKRGVTVNSSLELAKFFAAFIQLLGQFIKEGLDWENVGQELNTVKSNVMKLRNVSTYNSVLFDTSNINIPKASNSVSEDFRFLNANRSKKTSISKIILK